MKNCLCENCQKTLYGGHMICLTPLPPEPPTPPELRTIGGETSVLLPVLLGFIAGSILSPFFFILVTGS